MHVLHVSDDFHEDTKKSLSLILIDLKVFTHGETAHQMYKVKTLYGQVNFDAQQTLKQLHKITFFIISYSFDNLGTILINIIHIWLLTKLYHISSRMQIENF